MSHFIKPNKGETILIDVTPQSAGWQYLRYRVVNLKPGETYSHETGSDEAALVPLSGKAIVTAGTHRFEVARISVFTEKPHVLYTPPGTTITVEAATEFEFAIGSAPAEGKYPIRLFEPSEIKSEVRGGGVATRQVNHILSYPLPAERLILFEVYVPGGAWSGWPPHCHDGYGGSAHLDETYYFRIEPNTGYAFHRNYRVDSDFDEAFTPGDGDLVLVTQGFHSTAAAPGSNVYFLNYLAGELIDDARGTPPFDDPEWAWMKENWTGNAMKLPIMGD